MSDLLNHAQATHRAGQSAEAERLYREVLAREPGNHTAHHKLCVLLLQTGQSDKALAAADHALSFDPQFALAHFHRATALFALERYAEALPAYDAGLARDANIAMQAARFFTGLYICDWNQYDARLSALMQAIEQNRFQPSPFQLLFLPATLRQQRLAAERTATQMPQVPPLAQPTRKPGRLRIAYLSGDFRRHPVTYLITETLEQHDREQVEIFAISYGPDDGSSARARLARAVEHFIDVMGKSDAAIAADMAALNLDIIVDLDGYTEDARPGILSHRPAPVQVSYLGFPGTMGARHYDYVIADNVITPPEHQPYYSEKIVRLPVCYLPSATRPANATFSRADAGLPESGFVFCAFTAPYKITPPAFDSWMRILSRTPGSVLWLRGGTTIMESNLRYQAQARGVDPKRLVFAAQADGETYFARLALAHLYLDTFGYGAHTTASDALWSALPAVTLLGETFARRVASSLLTDAGLPELIARTPDEYEHIATSLAADAAVHAHLKAHLAQRRDNLFDAARFARLLESAYRTMAERQELGQKPEPFYV